MSKIAIFGGSFNPVHLGHIKLAEAFNEYYRFDKILIIPTFIPPHKTGEYLAPAPMRLEMCKLAFSHIKNAEVSDIEFYLKGKSYSYHTLLKLKEIYPLDDIYFIMGSDMFLSLESWYEYNKLKQLCIFCAAAREKQEYDKLMVHKAFLEHKNARCCVLSIKETVISSTEIREKLQKQLSVNCIIPENVLNYIHKNHLYTNHI